MTFLGLGIIKTWFDKLTNRFASALSFRNVNLLTVTLVASVTLAVLDTAASALVLRILNYCFPLSYFDFAQHRLQVGKDYMQAYISALAAPSVKPLRVFSSVTTRDSSSKLGSPLAAPSFVIGLFLISWWVSRWCLRVPLECCLQKSRAEAADFRGNASC